MTVRGMIRLARKKAKKRAKSIGFLCIIHGKCVLLPKLCDGGIIVYECSRCKKIKKYPKGDTL